MFKFNGIEEVRRTKPKVFMTIVIGVMFIFPAIISAWVYDAHNNTIDTTEVDVNYINYDDGKWVIVDTENDVWKVRGSVGDLDEEDDSVTLYRQGGWHKYDRESWYSNKEGPANENEFIVSAGSGLVFVLCFMIAGFAFVWNKEINENLKRGEKDE